MSTKNKPFKLKEIQFSCTAHTTEDLDKVKLAVLHLIPEDLREKVEIQITEMTGHARNEMHLLDLVVSQNRSKTKTLEYLAAKITELDKDSLYENFSERIDDNNWFYMRFNKQEAYKENIMLDFEDNTIRAVIKFIVYKQEPDLLKNTLEEYGIIKKG